VRFGVDGVDECAAVLELQQDALAIGATGQRVGERSADALEQAGPQEQVAHLGRLMGKDLADEVLGHGPLGAENAATAASGSSRARERQRGQPQAGRPALRCGRAAWRSRRRRA